MKTQLSSVLNSLIQEAIMFKKMATKDAMREDLKKTQQGSRSARLSPQSMTIQRVHVQQCVRSDNVKVE